MPKNNYYLYTFDYISFELIEWLTTKYNLTCFDTENALYLDKTITGTELGNRILAHLEAVIQREVEGGGALPDELLLGSIEQKVNNDPEFRGFLFVRFPLKKLLWEKVDTLLTKLGMTLPPMILLMPYENTRELKKKIDEISHEALDDTNFEDFKLLSLADDYMILEPLIRYFGENNRLVTINISNKTTEQIFKEISGIIEQQNS